MPLEIKELQIKVTVNDEQPGRVSSLAQGARETNEGKKEMVQQCIDDVMDILNRKKER